MVSCAVEDRAPELKDLHATDSRFWDVVNYKTYHLFEKLHTCKGEMDARMGKYSKHMETLKEANKSDYKELIRVLRFLAQFKRACGSNGVSEGMTV